ncbi:unnamed protein product, partial [Prorocentrum cordatum]
APPRAVPKSIRSKTESLEKLSEKGPALAAAAVAVGANAEGADADGDGASSDDEIAAPRNVEMAVPVRTQKPYLCELLRFAGSARDRQLAVAEPKGGAGRSRNPAPLSERCAIGVLAIGLGETIGVSCCL